MKDCPFIIVSNRLPVHVSKVNGKLEFSTSSGGLATAMSSLDTGTDRLWIGWPGIDSDDLTSADRATISRKLKTYGCVPVFLSREQVKNFYEGYANDTLWPLFHSFQAFAKFDNNYWPAYQTVNKLFAATVARYADAKATIWVHDYHLTLLPQMLRTAIPSASIGFFLHVPFPAFEIFRLLPQRKQILEGMLGADLVGFHTYDYVRYFMNSVLRTLGHENRHGTIALKDRSVATDAFPIGIDYQKFTDLLSNPETKRELQVLEQHYQGKKIILSVDRLDYSKGILHRLRAFEEFLNQSPQFLKKVALIIIAVPSRTGVEAYQGLRDEIEQMVSRINGQYTTLDWTPISYQFQNIPVEQLTALYSRAAVALVTPLRDGMNLVAKEFVACKQKSPGVLILSEFAGAADELQEAISINPNDTPAIVRALKQALTMPIHQQKTRMRSMQQRISHYTVQRWAKDFITQLGAAARQFRRAQPTMTMAQQQELIRAFKHAKRRSIFLDYDGTLMNFVSTPDPAKAKPKPKLFQLLKAIAATPNTKLHIISGRTREALEMWFHDLPATLVAEHGSWIKHSGKWTRSPMAFRNVKTKIRPLLERYAERTPGAFVEEKDFALVWHYRNTKPELAYARVSNLRHELESLTAGSEVGVFSGNKIIEIKPHAAQKGRIVAKMLRSDPADFVLCVGDDYTDEDMFQALADSAYTIKVGRGNTAARLRVASVEKVITLLGLLQQSLPAAGKAPATKLPK